MHTELAPIVLFVYNRSNHTKQTLSALKNNYLSDESILYIYADGPKVGASKEMVKKIELTREIARSKKWCKEVYIIESKTNKGLADSILQGVTEIVNKYGKIIVLEDDIVTTPQFLIYMNLALDYYQNNNNVFHINGFNNETKLQWILPNFYFLNFMSCWGWATWKDRWNKLNKNFKTHLNEVLGSKKYFDKYNYDGVIDFHTQLESNISGQIRTWAILWYSSIMQQNGLCLTPKYSFVKNIGMDGTGENCTVTNNHKKLYITKEIQGKNFINKFPQRKLESNRGRLHLKFFYNYGQISILRIIYLLIKAKLRNLLRHLK